MCPSEAAGNDPLVHCAGAVVRDGEGRLLLIQRANEPGRGRWSLPGGRVEPGESAAAAAVREVHEETGLEVAVTGLLGTVALPGGYTVDDFSAVVNGGTLVPGDDALDARWFALSELGSVPLTTGLLDELARMGIESGG
jgi:acetyl-CoA carboxylase carboxyl transferase subunit beta